MADVPPYPDTGVRAGHGSTTSTPPPTPRWVKVSGIIALVPVLLFVIMMLTDMLTGSGHGPARHIPSSSVIAGIIALVLVLLLVARMLTGSGHGPGRHRPSSSVTEHREQQP